MSARPTAVATPAAGPPAEHAKTSVGMKSLALHIQSSLDSLDDCLREISDATAMVRDQEDAEQDPPVSSSALDRVLAHCQKARRELRSMATKVR